MNFEGVVINVTDLSRSVDFYREVLEFSLLSHGGQLAALNASGSDRSQVVVLREFADGHLGGARHAGLRAFLLEVESNDRLERIASELDSRGLFLGWRRQGDWTAVMGRDPSGVAFAATSAPEVGLTAEESWKTLDDTLYGIGE
jgi:catechol-2,3-dioxygenase